MDPQIWPVIQLFDLTANSSPEITMRIGATERSVVLNFDTAEDVVSLTLDRETYPQSAQVGFTIMDPTLNVDPTDEDTWTWNSATGELYYMIFDDRGALAVDNLATAGDLSDVGTGANPGIIPLNDFFGDIGFDVDNGTLTLSTDAGGVAIVEINADNPDQTQTAIVDSNPNGDDLVEFTFPITVVETGATSDRSPAVRRRYRKR